MVRFVEVFVTTANLPDTDWKSYRVNVIYTLVFSLGDCTSTVCMYCTNNNSYYPYYIITLQIRSEVVIHLI